MSKDKNERISKSCKSNVKDGQDLLHIWKDQFGGTSNSIKRGDQNKKKKNQQIILFRLQPIDWKAFFLFFIEED